MKLALKSIFTLLLISVTPVPTAAFTETLPVSP